VATAVMRLPYTLLCFPAAPLFIIQYLDNMAGEPIIINTLKNNERQAYRNPAYQQVEDIAPFILHEPKRESRFVVTFPEQFGLESFFVQKIDRPKMILSNSNYEWQNIKIEFIDVIGPSTSRRLYDIIELFKEQKKQRIWFFFKQKFEPFTIYVDTLDPTGVEVERWSISIKDIIKVDFGEFNYASDEIQKCSLTIKPLDCVYIR
jgi:hypothetical protein